MALLAAAWLAFSVARTEQAPAERDSSLLDQSRRLTEVAAQKTETEVRGALREVQRVASAEPEKALTLLKKVLAQLDEDSTPESRRKALQRMLQDRIRVIGTAPDDPSAIAQNRGKPAENQRSGEDETATDQVKILRLREGVRKWQKENSAAAQAENRTSSVNKQLSDNRQLQLERERRTNGALRDVDKTALPPKGDMEFPKDWQAKTKDRKGSNDVPLTAKERALLRALDTIVSVRFKNSRFEDVIEFLQTTIGQPIFVDKAAMEAAEVTYETRVTVEVKGVTARSLLRKVLNDLGLAYIIKGEAIQVVTPQVARETMSTRVQYIGDLMFAFTKAQRLFQAAQLIDMIQNTVDPPAWQVNGGLATITYNDITRSLVIKAPAEIHPVLSSGLR
jgi:hypothetical protein